MRRGLRADYAANARLLARVNRLPGQEDVPILLPSVADNPMVARRRQPDIATERVSLRPVPAGKNVKANQAWKYPGFNIVRADSVQINGRFYTDPKEHTDDYDDAAGKQGQPIDTMAGNTDGTPRRKQESNFLITINPNQSYGPTVASAAELAFKGALAHLSETNVLVRCLKFGPKDKFYLNDNARDVILPGVSWTASVEVGEVAKRMHCHIWCTIEHYSQIQINVPMMQREFMDGFNAHFPAPNYNRLSEPPYLQVKLLPQSNFTTVMRQYIKKGMQS